MSEPEYDPWFCSEECSKKHQNNFDIDKCDCVECLESAEYEFTHKVEREGGSYQYGETEYMSMICTLHERKDLIMKERAAFLMDHMLENGLEVPKYDLEAWRKKVEKKERMKERMIAKKARLTRKAAKCLWRIGGLDVRGSSFTSYKTPTKAPSEAPEAPAAPGRCQ
jgi:hypothetical protein